MINTTPELPAIEGKRAVRGQPDARLGDTDRLLVPSDAIEGLGLLGDRSDNVPNARTMPGPSGGNLDRRTRTRFSVSAGFAGACESSGVVATLGDVEDLVSSQGKERTRAMVVGPVRKPARYYQGVQG